MNILLPEKRYYGIGEIAKAFGINPSMIRHWEKEIKVLNPQRNNKGNRRYTPDDLKKIEQVYHLVKEKGLTLEGVNTYFKNHKKAELDVLEKLQSLRNELIKMRNAI